MTMAGTSSVTSTQLQWYGPYTYQKNSQKKKTFSEYERKTLSQLNTEFPKAQIEEKVYDIIMKSDNIDITTSKWYSHMQTVMNYLQSVCEPYTIKGISDILLRMESDIHSASSNEDGGHPPTPKTIKQNFYSERDVGSFARVLREFLQWYRFVEEKQYSDDTVKHFMCAVLNIAIWDIGELVTVMSTTSRENQLLSMVGYAVKADSKETIKFCGTPDVAIINTFTKQKFLIAEGKSASGGGVGQLLLASLFSGVEERNNPKLSFLLTPREIHLYKICKDECNIYIKQVYQAKNKKHLEDFLPILAIVRQELLIVLPHK